MYLNLQEDIQLFAENVHVSFSRALKEGVGLSTCVTGFKYQTNNDHNKLSRFCLLRVS